MKILRLLQWNPLWKPVQRRNGKRFAKVWPRKTLQKVDRFSRIPNDILVEILSVLPFRTAVHVSSLCHSLRNLWRHGKVVEFDSTRFISLDSFLDYVSLWKTHFTYTDLVRMSVIFGTTMINTNNAADAITDIINLGVEKGAKDITMVFKPRIQDMWKVAGERFSIILELPDSFFITTQIESFKLSLCRLKIPVLSSFVNLQKLTLCWITISNEDLRNLFQCLSLVHFGIECCNGLEDLDILDPIPVRSLTVKRCISISLLSVEAPNLTEFVFDGLYPDIYMTWDNVVENIICDFDYMDPLHLQGQRPIDDMITSFTDLKKLTITTFAINGIVKASSFYNPKISELSLIMGYCCYHKELVTISNMLKAFPSLKKLSVIFEDARDPPIVKTKAVACAAKENKFVPPDCLTSSLRMLCVNGYRGKYGGGLENCLIVYALTHGRMLEELVIEVDKSDQKFFADAKKIQNLYSVSKGLKVTIR